MRFLGGILTLAGYMLVYAAVAKQGQFATEPWAGLFTDAYASTGTGTTNTAAASSPNGAAASSTNR